MVLSRFNASITSGLLAGAEAAFADAGVPASDVTIVQVPGAFEIPVAARHLARGGQFEAIVCLGCLIKGDTMHFEYIAEAVAHGITAVSIDTGVPVSFGVLTTMTEEQAEVRAAPGEGNKGREAANAAIEMAILLRRLGRDGATAPGSSL